MKTTTIYYLTGEGYPHITKPRIAASFIDEIETRWNTGFKPLNIRHNGFLQPDDIWRAIIEQVKPDLPAMLVNALQLDLYTRACKLLHLRPEPRCWTHDGIPFKKGDNHRDYARLLRAIAEMHGAYAASAPAPTYVSDKETGCLVSQPDNSCN